MRSTFIITGEITPQVANQFFWLAGADEVNDVVISSPGGDSGLTFGMFDTIKFNGINTHAVGLVQSAAAVLLQAGALRTMTNSSLLMFHAPSETEITDQVFRIHTQLVEMVQQRTGMSLMEAHDIFDGHFINANRALELNLIDEIAEDAEWYRWVKNGKLEKQQPNPGVGTIISGPPGQPK